MSEPGNDEDTTSGTVIGTVTGTVWPWKTLASLGITENDLTGFQESVHGAHARVGVASGPAMG
ncbi:MULTISPECIES: hypothetical protein [Streptomyces]|uniref:hypothetical protein n=1 Tax=Streptomyces TaxID=1883 RepID=UPI00084BF36F|nr:MULTISPECIES: hypothetical protein [Streptomyces]TFI23374.1 hypothetical protein E4P36_26825 [Streptomyces sp. 4R-3d]